MSAQAVPEARKFLVRIKRDSGASTLYTQHCADLLEALAMSMSEHKAVYGETGDVTFAELAGTTGARF